MIWPGTEKNRASGSIARGMPTSFYGGVPLAVSDIGCPEGGVAIGDFLRRRSKFCKLLLVLSEKVKCNSIAPTS